jgi:hypothetical protein
MWRYNIVELPRADIEKREALLWELGRSGWEMVQILPGSWADGSAAETITLVFKRPAGDDIGV